jgi:hypothetical protein
MKSLEGQLSLVLFPEKQPAWEDVQKGRAETVNHGAYARPCTRECLYSSDVFELCGERTCFLFGKPIRDGMCPSTVHLEWT